MEDEDILVDRMLRERAIRYAQAPQRIAADAKAEVLLFRLREEKYAVELRLLRRIQHTRGLTPVPCTPPHVAGILNIRGEVVTVLDLASAIGLDSPRPPSESSRVLLAELPEGTVGLLVDEVLGDHRLPVGSLARALSGKDFLRGVAEASILFLDLEQLLSGGRLDVFEEVT